MNRLVFFLFPAIFIACSDGDLQIETIDFDAEAVQFCGGKATTATTIFFKISSDEALILQLQNGLLKNEASAGTLSSTVPGQSKLTYRIFSDDVVKEYFCSDIPPGTPLVTEEIEASAGEVLITTVMSANDTTAFEHNIRLSGISLVNEQGERITDLSINDFGIITTVAN